MTMHELAGLVLRRWYVFAAFLMLFLLVLPFTRSPDVFMTTAEVNFHTPVTLPKALHDADNTETLISFAGAVVGKYSADRENPVLSSPNASLYGNGIRNGESVALSSIGSQWQVGFDRPTAVVRVAGDSPEQVTATTQEVFVNLSTIANELQRESGVEEKKYITTAMDLDSLNVSAFGQTRTGKYKGTVVFLAVGLVASTLLADALDRWLLDRRRKIRRIRPTNQPRPLVLQNSTADFPSRP